MKRLTLQIAALLVTFAGSMAAAQTTVDQMTCAQAQDYFSRNGFYYKDAHYGYPVKMVALQSPYQCPSYMVPMTNWEHTRDVRHCVLGYYCHDNH